MQDHKRPEDTKRPGAPPGGSAAAPDEDRSRNSGRPAAGQGGGDMEPPEEFPEEHHETGYEYSGGGQGHEANRSLARDTDEDVESPSGPYTRAGHPAKSAQPKSEPRDAEVAGKKTPDKRTDHKK